jgi:cardiolipin synthase
MKVKAKSNSPLNVANALTFLRIAVIPVIYVGLALESTFGRFLAAGLFLFACVTDYADGFVARHFGQVTKLGEFLDPVADKILVGSTLLFLAGFGHLDTLALIPASIILSREMIVSGLRDLLVESNKSLTVSSLAKWKTATQLTALSLILLSHPEAIGNIAFFVGTTLLYVSAVLTVITGYQYFRGSL